MVTGEGIEHMGIAGLEGHGIAGLPVSSGIGHIHDGVITAAANHFHRPGVVAVIVDIEAEGFHFRRNGLGQGIVEPFFKGFVHKISSFL